MKSLMLAAGAAAILAAGAAQAQQHAAAHHRTAAAASHAGGSRLDPARLGGHPNLNGIWEVLSTANYDVEPHEAAQAPAAPEKFGANAAIPPSSAARRCSNTSCVGFMMRV